MALLINGIDRPAIYFSSETVNLPGGGTTRVEFLPYTRPSSSAVASQNGETVEGQRIRRVREAIGHIARRIANYAPANDRFRRLRRGRTLAQLISEAPDIIICVSPANYTIMGAAPVVTAAHPSPAQMRLTITGLCFHGRGASGRRVEATILHELAHLNGADSSSHDAEGVLLRSRMGDQHDSEING